MPFRGEGEKGFVDRFQIAVGRLEDRLQHAIGVDRSSRRNIAVVGVANLPFRGDRLRAEGFLLADFDDADVTSVCLPPPDSAA